jgi:hypothetical protein
VTSPSDPLTEGPDEQPPDLPRQLRRATRRKQLIALLVVVLIAGGAALAVTDPFGNHPASATQTASSADPTGYTTITQGPLSSQTQVNATLGYAGSYSAVNQAQGTYTSLPATGKVIHQGQVLYRVSGSPVVLMYGSVPVYRALSEGIIGPDVRQLNADLVALGYATRSELSPKSDDFSSATATAVDKLQRHLGVTETGSIALGKMVFVPAALRVTSVMGTLGTPAAPAQVVARGTSTTRVVTVALNADEQTDVQFGDKVMITLPNNTITPGEVTSIGSVATTNSSGVATINVGVTPLDPKATGSLDQAPVQVSITTATVASAMIVQVDALLAQPGGKYAVEVAPAGGPHRLVQVTLGLFDDAAGTVQISGPGIHAGQRVVVPSL